MVFVPFDSSGPFAGLRFLGGPVIPGYLFGRNGHEIDTEICWQPPRLAAAPTTPRLPGFSLANAADMRPAATPPPGPHEAARAGELMASDPSNVQPKLGLHGPNNQAVGQVHS